jgi:hypothetical protein
MFVIFFKKSNSEIVGFRDDQSAPPLTEDEITNHFYSDNAIADNSVNHAVVPQQKFVSFNAGKYLFNTTTNTVSENPSYVATPDSIDPTPAT